MTQVTRMILLAVLFLSCRFFFLIEHMWSDKIDFIQICEQEDVLPLKDQTCGFN